MLFIIIIPIIFSLIVPATNSSPVLTNNQQLKNQTCFSSCHPEAQKIRSIYDLDVDEGVFWSRNGFLPPCFSLSRDFVQSQCLTCMDQTITPQTVQVFCLNLTANMNLIMEGPEGIIHFNKTMCPLPPTPLSPEMDQSGHILPIVFIVLIILIILMGIGIILLVVKWCRSQKDRICGSENRNNSVV